MIIEMRTYLLKPCTIPIFEERFAEALPARTQLSPLGGFWHSESGTLNEVIHVWAYSDLSERERIGAEARKTGKWPPKVQEFMLAQRSTILTPAPFSPPLEARRLGSIYEICTDTCKPGGVPSVLGRWEARIEERLKLSPLAACWQSAIGSLNRLVHIWPYSNAADRERIRAGTHKSGVWPPGCEEFIMKQESTLVIPAAFSPLH